MSEMKITDRQVREIRQWRAYEGPWKHGRVSLRWIAVHYGISEAQVSRICSGKRRLTLSAQ